MTPIVVVGLGFQASDTEDVELVGWAWQGETNRSTTRIKRTASNAFMRSIYYGEGRPHKR